MDKSLHLDQRTSAELAAIIVEAGLILQQRSSQPAHDSSPTNKIPANQRSSSVEQTSDRWQQWQPDGEWQQGTDQGAQPYRFSGIRKALYKQPPPRRSAERSEACPEGGPAPKSKAPPPARGSAERAQAYPEGGPPEPNLQSPPPETFAAYAQAGPPEQRSKGPPPPAAPSSAERSEGFPKGGSQQFQGPNYKMPPPQSPRTIERIQNAGKMETLTATVRRIHAIQASGLEFGWVFALDLPQNFEKKMSRARVIVCILCCTPTRAIRFWTSLWMKKKIESGAKSSREFVGTLCKHRLSWQRHGWMGMDLGLASIIYFSDSLHLNLWMRGICQGFSEGEDRLPNTHKLSHLLTHINSPMFCTSCHMLVFLGHRWTAVVALTFLRADAKHHCTDSVASVILWTKTSFGWGSCLQREFCQTVLDELSETEISVGSGWTMVNLDQTRVVWGSLYWTLTNQSSLMHILQRELSFAGISNVEKGGIPRWKFRISRSGLMCGFSVCFSLKFHSLLMFFFGVQQSFWVQTGFCWGWEALQTIRGEIARRNPEEWIFGGLCFGIGYPSSRQLIKDCLCWCSYFDVWSAQVRMGMNRNYPGQQHVKFLCCRPGMVGTTMPCLHPRSAF